MRYEVGKNHTFIRINYTNKTEDAKWARTYMPWLHDLIAIEIVVLTCTEHHKVDWDQDPEQKKTNDGFIFINRDVPNERWANQYPSASYGQLDDSADWYVRRHFETHELLKVDAAGEVVKDTEGKSIIIDQAKWDIFDQQFWRPFEHAEKRLSELYRVINKQGHGQHLDDELIEQLKPFMQQLIDAVEEKSGQKVVFERLKPDWDYMVARLRNAEGNTDDKQCNV